MLGLRLPELLIILAVLILMFGATKLPALGDSLGKGIRAFKKATEPDADDDKGAASKTQDQLEASAKSTPAAGPATSAPAAAETAKAERKGTPSA